MSTTRRQENFSEDSTLTNPTDTKFTQSSSPMSLSSEHPSEVLKRTLTTRSAVSTSDRIDRVLAKSQEKPALRTIGLGSCGTVFELPGTHLAYKKGSNTDAIWTDFILTNRVHNATHDILDLLQDAFPSRTIPRTPACHQFRLPGGKEFWDESLQRFPEEHRSVGALFLVDRILPLPQATRKALIREYFDADEEVQREAMKDEENEHCLVRVYLGERETSEQRIRGYDSLRNFPMRLNMVEDLELEVFDLAAEMAIGLAVLHWQAQVDGMDAEFVLGSVAEKGEEGRPYDREAPPHDVDRYDFTRRPIHLWMLDFDKASRFELTPKDVNEKLVPAFLGNDPYYPRPDGDKELCEEFSKTYLKASDLILRNKKQTPSVKRLAQRFLDKVEEMVRLHEDWDPEEHIVFGD